MSHMCYYLVIQAFQFSLTALNYLKQLMKDAEPAVFVPPVMSSRSRAVWGVSGWLLQTQPCNSEC